MSLYYSSENTINSIFIIISSLIYFSTNFFGSSLFFVLSSTDLPKDGPHISGEQQQQYQIGDYLNLNCTSGKSHPASVLQWYINDQPVSEHYFLFS